MGELDALANVPDMSYMINMHATREMIIIIFFSLMIGDDYIVLI